MLTDFNGADRVYIACGYFAKKQAESKHYNVAISHAAKKLALVIYTLQKTDCPYR